jgi:hypothetical protein
MDGDNVWCVRPDLGEHDLSVIDAVITKVDRGKL